MLWGDETKSKPLLGIAAYGIAISLLYEWAYWGSFNINILQFISLSDIPKIAAYPLVVSFGSYIGVITNAANLREQTISTKFVDNIIALKSKTLKLSIVVTYLSLLFLPLYFMKIAGWIVFSMLLTPVAFVMLDSTGLVQLLFPTIPKRSELTLLLTVFLIFSYAYGKTNAEEILMRSKYDTAKIEGLSDNIIYLGHAGDYIFFTSMDDSTTIYQRAADTKTMELKKHNNTLTNSQRFRTIPF